MKYYIVLLTTNTSKFRRASFSENTLYENTHAMLQIVCFVRNFTIAAVGDDAIYGIRGDPSAHYLS